jgi:RES domain-containing protein
VTPLPAPLGGAELVAWRIDFIDFAPTWDTSEGAYRVGGRWNSKGIRAVYCSLDPATAILEVAVHKTFRVLDTVPHVLTAVTILEPPAVHIVDPTSVPNPHWLHPGIPSAGQQAYGDQLLKDNKFVAIPSAVSTHSWNFIFIGSTATGAYKQRFQERLAVDTRLHPPI